SVLDLSDLARNKAQPRHIALQLRQSIWRQRHSLRGVHGCQTLGRLAQGWFEVANVQPGQGGLYPVHDAGAFPHQAFALPVGPLSVLFGNRRYAGHAAMAPFPTQPPQEPPLQQRGVEPVGFRLHCETRALTPETVRIPIALQIGGGPSPYGSTTRTMSADAATTAIRRRLSCFGRARFSGRAARHLPIAERRAMIAPEAGLSVSR